MKRKEKQSKENFFFQLFATLSIPKLLAKTVKLCQCQICDALALFVKYEA